jgi:DNA-binding MarR family transcriptional regulator
MTAAKERLRLWLRLLKVVRGVEGELRDRLRQDFGTTLPRFDMLAALSRHPEGLKMSQLSGLLRVSGGNVTGLADRLAEDGLVERVPVPHDRRATMLRLTHAGRTQFAAQAQAHEDWIDQLLAEVSSDDAREMATRLAAFAKARDAREAAHAQ